MNERKIFVVDDDMMLSMMLCDHLSENPNYKVMEYDTGESCLQDMGLFPDVVILDYNLDSVTPSAKNGVEIMREIRKIKPETFVIILSSQQVFDDNAPENHDPLLEYIRKDDNSFNRIDEVLNARLAG